MIPFGSLGLNYWDFLVIFVIGILVFIITKLLYPPLIKWLNNKKYIGYDIHKANRPATAESGGVGITFGIIFGSVLIMIFFPQIWRETLVFLITVIIAAIIGWIDDRKQLRSIVKMGSMFIAGIPMFIANLWFINFIDVESPSLPFLGQLRLTIIYPLTIPFIIMIMTNTVNMLEGYNGEGSGTCTIASLFLLVIAFIMQSTEGFVFSMILLGALLAFFTVNRYPAKAFPGDVGTLTIGAALGCIGILGSIEFAMIIVMLPQVFNSFYVIASVRGFKESHDIKKKDIYQDEDDFIIASFEQGAPLTLPRLIVGHGKLKEPQLVNHFLILSLISGCFAILSVLFIPDIQIHIAVLIILIVICIGLISMSVIKFSAIRGLAIIMFSLLSIAMISFWIVDLYIVDRILNWLFGGLIGIIILIVWYGVTLIYFRKICVNGTKSKDH